MLVERPEDKSSEEILGNDQRNLKKKDRNVRILELVRIVLIMQAWMKARVIMKTMKRKSKCLQKAKKLRVDHKEELAQEELNEMSLKMIVMKKC
jgi:hypothetical protein